MISSTIRAGADLIGREVKDAVEIERDDDRDADTSATPNAANR